MTSLLKKAKQHIYINRKYKDEFENASAFTHLNIKKIVNS